MLTTKEKPFDAGKQTEGRMKEDETSIQRKNNTSAIEMKPQNGLSELITLEGNTPLTNSLILAEKFAKRHDNVINKIENLIQDDKNTDLNFKVSEYKDSTGRVLKMYIMDRRSFSILSMGFTGKKAMKWKIAFYDAFESMEKILLQQRDPFWQQERLEGKQTRRYLTDAIQKLVKFAELSGSKNPNIYYTNIPIMVNKTVFGLSKVSHDFRDTLNIDSLKQLQLVEWTVAQWLNNAVDECSDYHEPYYIIKNQLESLVNVIGHITPSPLIAA